MVEMRVRQNDGVDAVRGDGQRLPVSLTKLLKSLKEAAIDEDFVGSGVQKVLGSRDGSGGSEEGQRRHWGES